MTGVQTCALPISSATINFLQGVDQIIFPSSDDLDSLRTSEDDIRQLSSLKNRLTQTRAVVGRLVGVEGVVYPSPEDFDGLKQAHQDLLALQSLRLRYSNSFAQVQKIQGIETISAEIDTTLAEKILSTIQVVVGLRDRVETARSGVAALTQELVSLETEEAQLTENILGVIGTLGQCPVCGSTVAQGDEQCQQSSGSP